MLNEIQSLIQSGKANEAACPYGIFPFAKFKASAQNKALQSQQASRVMLCTPTPRNTHLITLPGLVPHT